jgi:hypothetical protein
VDRLLSCRWNHFPPPNIFPITQSSATRLRVFRGRLSQSGQGPAGERCEFMFEVCRETDTEATAGLSSRVAHDPRRRGTRLLAMTNIVRHCEGRARSNLFVRVCSVAERGSMTIQAHQGSALRTRLMALLPVLCEDGEERGGGVVKREGMDNRFCLNRGTRAATGQQGAGFGPFKTTEAFLNKIEQTEITQHLDIKRETVT